MTDFVIEFWRSINIPQIIAIAVMFWVGHCLYHKTSQPIKEAS